MRLKTCVVAMPLYQPVTAGPMEWNAEDDVESARMATRVTSQLVSVRAVAKQDGSFPIAIQVRFNPVRLVIMMVVGGKVSITDDWTSGHVKSVTSLVTEFGD